MTPTDARELLRQAGLSQSGLARHLIELGDQRPFNEVLRSVQRAVRSDRDTVDWAVAWGLREVAARSAADKNLPDMQNYA